MGDNLDELVAIVKDTIGNLIAKPKMVDKLLQKPPFRFLHDIISAVTTTTGFGEGLYSDSELDSASITEKGAKIAYLEKIFSLVGICQGGQLEVKAAKVVAGLEPEFTNKFLLSLAQCASDPSLDNGDAVRRCLSGEQPGEGPPATRKNSGGRAESKSDSSSSSSSSSSSYQDNNGDAKGSSGSGAKASAPSSGAYEAKGSMPSQDNMDLGMGNQQLPSQERGKSRGGTRGGRAPQASADTGLSGPKGKFIVVSLLS